MDNMHRKHSSPLHWGAGVALAALLAGGGVIGGIALAGNAGPAAPSATTASGVTTEDAALNAALSGSAAPAASTGFRGSGTATPGGGPGSPAGTAVKAALSRCVRAVRSARAAGNLQQAHRIRRSCLRPLIRRLALRGVEGQFTIRTRSGYRTLAWERGTVQSVTPGHSIVVKAPDGTTWTWNLLPGTAVRQPPHGKTASSALASGEQVWVGGPLAGTAKDARLIVIRPAKGAPATSSPSASTS